MGTAPSARVLLLTGTTGIAAATARLAVADGIRVGVLGIDTATGAGLVEEMRGAGGDVWFVPVDLTDAEAVERGVAECTDRFGRIDALFNVAGISGRRYGDAPIHECTEAGWDTTIETNLKSMFLVCRAVIGRMMHQPPASGGVRGAVLNMASVLAASPQPRFFATHAYAASKAAVIGMTRSMAGYYAPHGIRVNAVAPGLVRTPMSHRAQQNEEILTFMRSKQPLVGGMIEAEDVARAALFLLGDGARAITGDVVTVDGGWSVSG